MGATTRTWGRRKEAKGSERAERRDTSKFCVTASKALPSPPFAGHYQARHSLSLVHEEARQALKVFLENLFRDAATLTEYARKKTVRAKDVVNAFKRQREAFVWF